MCGIALVLSGDCLVVAPSTAAAAVAASGTPFSDEGKGVSVGELEEALRRRGPDSLGCHRLHLCLADGTIVGATDGVDCDGGDGVGGGVGATELCFIGATLQLRGAEPVSQPLVAQSGSVLVYNGEIYGGINIANDQNDTQSLFSSLEFCCCCDLHVADRDEAYPCRESVGKSVPQILSTIKGPWALIYWQTDSKTLWFGRDAFGRRSLLVHWPSPDDSRFILSSVSPPSFSRNNSATEVNDLESGADPNFSDYTKVSYWEELPCGLYSIHLKDLDNSATCMKEGCVVEVRKHDWTDSSLHTLIRWERKSTVPIVDGLIPDTSSVDKGNHHLSLSFRNSSEAEDSISNGLEKRDLPSDICLYPGNCITVSTKSINCTKGICNGADKCEQSVSASLSGQLYRVLACGQGDLNKLKDTELAPIAILFSGGLDSMILAALLDQCLDSKWTIDLLNVSFDGKLAPDRVSSLAGLKELQRISPLRRWRLVEIDSDLANLKEESKHVMSLIYPSNTYMDLNIGIALWLAAGGDGWVNEQDGHRYKHKSTSRVLLVGSGADEQCAGYGRHRTKYRLGGWVSLDEEMRLDVQRIWKRNMGRDDRCISDHGKEARFPFLDENVIGTLLEIPLWEIAKLDEPVGKGDKKILREVAKLLGLQEAAFLPKRAIQFGSRIARESNRKNFGSNRAANMASAGSVEVHKRNR